MGTFLVCRTARAQARRTLQVYDDFSYFYSECRLWGPLQPRQSSCRGAQACLACGAALGALVLDGPCPRPATIVSRSWRGTLERRELELARGCGCYRCGSLSRTAVTAFFTSKTPHHKKMQSSARLPGWRSGLVAPAQRCWRAPDCRPLGLARLACTPARRLGEPLRLVSRRAGRWEGGPERAQATDPSVAASVEQELAEAYKVTAAPDRACWLRMWPQQCVSWPLVAAALLSLQPSPARPPCPPPTKEVLLLLLLQLQQELEAWLLQLAGASQASAAEPAGRQLQVGRRGVGRGAGCCPAGLLRAEYWARMCVCIYVCE